MAAMALWAAVASGFPRQAADGEGPLQHFHNAVDAYIALHEAVERTVPPLEMSPDAENIRLAIEAMAAAMRAARPSAREGDVFDAEAAAVLRRRIRATLRERGCDVAGILAAERDQRRPVPPHPLVHDQFDWGWGSMMPWCLLDVLPPLPGELQFRFVERDLVLVDTHANLVVDVLPDALPPAESWQWVTSLRTTKTSSAAPSACATSQATGTPPRGKPSTSTSSRPA